MGSLSNVRSIRIEKVQLLHLKISSAGAQMVDVKSPGKSYITTGIT